MNTATESPLADFGFYIDIDGTAATVKAIQAVLAKLEVRDRWCVEFGAWDGFVGSTSRDLITNHGYSAVLIEGSEAKFRDLKRNYADSPQVIARNQFVGFHEQDGLDVILTATPIPRDFDFLTVDIDGNDFHVWHAVRRYEPKVVMIEFNPTIPLEISFVQPADPEVNQGSSLTAMVELAQQKGYELISVIGVNAIFVRREYFRRFGIADNRAEALWTKRDCITYLFSGYDGKVFLRGCMKLPWHESITIEEARMQVLSSFLQGQPFTRRKRIIYECLRSPISVVRKIFRRLGKNPPRLS